jgi:hypothetical protein
MKARLAEMQRAKGKGRAIPDDLDDGYPPGMNPDRSEREREQERKEIEKREHKHA